MGMKQKKNQNGRLKKTEIFKPQINNIFNQNLRAWSLDL
jgi:hypothetical protein